MKKIGLVAMLAALVSTGAIASVQFFNQSGAEVGTAHQAQCGSGMSCALTSGKMVVANAAATINNAFSSTLSSSNCGQTFYSIAGSASGTVALPEASTVIGCQYRFVVGTGGGTLDVNPDDADIIARVSGNSGLVALSVGDALRGSIYGNSVTLQAIDGSAWVPVAIHGTWYDIN